MATAAGTGLESGGQIVAGASGTAGPWPEVLSQRAGLIWTLVRTDFKVRYHGTLGGFVWALFKPLTMFVLLMGVFSFLFASDPDYKFNLIIGLFLWDFFADGTKAGLTSLHARGFLLTRARFPSWILVVTSISNAVVTLVVFVVLIMAFLALAGRPPSPAALALFAGYCAALIVGVTAFALASCVLFLRYRDLNQVWDVAVQGGFFVAPIIYPLGILPERFHVYLYLWPPTPIIQFSRDVLVRGTAPTATAHLCLVGAAAASLLVGVVLFRRLGPRAAEYL
jgi:lipopolysaccharide transport system permease protein